MKRFSLRLKKELHEKLRRESFETEVSINEIVTKLIEEKYKEDKEMKRYFITNNAYREVVFAKGNKGFVFDSPDGIFEGVDLYQDDPAEVLSQLKKLEIDNSSYDDLCETFPDQVIEVNKEFFNANTAYEF